MTKEEIEQRAWSVVNENRELIESIMKDWTVRLLVDFATTIHDEAKEEDRVKCQLQVAKAPEQTDSDSYIAGCEDCAEAIRATKIQP